MKRPLVWFNTYLLAVALAALCACRTKSSEVKASSLQLHLEVNPDGTERSSPVPIYRASPVYVNVSKEPFLTESHIQQALLVDSMGGFELRVQYNRQGTWLLDQYSTSSKGKRLAIICDFGEVRWLAAPVLTRRITNGLLVFTPDASREEAGRIVAGLNKVAKKIRKRDTTAGW